MKHQKTIFRTIKSSCFVTVDRFFIDDSNLSLQAKGLLLYLLSKPDNFYNNEYEILKHCKNGRDSIRAICHELITHGYLIRSKLRDPSGSFVRSIWFVLEKPEFSCLIKDLFPSSEQFLSITNDKSSENCSLPSHPLPDNPSMVIPSPDKSHHNNNKNNKNDSNNQSISSKHFKFDVSDLDNDGLINYINSFIPDVSVDFSKLDFRELKLSLVYFDKNRANITNPVKYLKSVIKNCRVITKKEFDLMAKENDNLVKNTEFLNRLNKFEFDSIDEKIAAMKKFKNFDTRFQIWLNYPENLPPLSNYLLKSVYLRWLDKTKSKRFCH